MPGDPRGDLRLEASGYRRLRGRVWATVKAIAPSGAVLFADGLTLDDARARAAFIRELRARCDGAAPAEVEVKQTLLHLLAQAEAVLAADPQPGAPAAVDGVERAGPYLRGPDGMAWVRVRAPAAGGAPPVEEVVPLSNFVAEVAEELTLDDGAETRKYFLIRGRLGDQPLPEVRVSATEFAAMQWPTAHWGIAARVAPGSGRREYLRDAIQAFSAAARRRTVYAHTGWRRIGDRWYFLHAGGALGADGAAPDVTTELPPQLARYALPAPPSDPETTRAAVAALVRALDLGDPAVTYPALATVVTAPLGPALGTVVPAARGPALGLGFTTWLLGATGRWKSALQALLSHVYGGPFDDKSPPVGWEASDNALERLGFVAKDLPLWIDDFRPPATPREATELERRAQRFIREAANGVGRDRMRADTTLRPPLWPRCLAWSSGELLPGGQSTIARLLVVEVPARWTTGDALAVAQAEAPRWYPLAGAVWVQHVARELDRLRATLPGARDRVRDALLPELRHPQHALAAGKLITGFGAWLEHAVQVGALSPTAAAERLAIARTAIVACARRSGELAGEDRPAARFLDLVRTLLRQHRVHVRPIAGGHETGEPPADAEAWGWPATARAEDAAGGVRPPATPLIGWIDEDEQVVYVLPTAAVREVAEFSRNLPRRWLVSPEALGRDLAAAGLLARTDAGKHLVRKRVGPERVYVWALPADVLRDADTAAADEDVAEANHDPE